MFKCRYVWLQSPQPWLLGDITELFPQNSVEQLDIQPFQTKTERVPIEWSSSSPDQRGEKSPPDCRAPREEGRMDGWKGGRRSTSYNKAEPFLGGAAAVKGTANVWLRLDLTLAFAVLK